MTEHFIDCHRDFNFWQDIMFAVNIIFGVNYFIKFCKSTLVFNEFYIGIHLTFVLLGITRRFVVRKGLNELNMNLINYSLLIEIINHLVFVLLLFMFQDVSYTALFLLHFIAGYKANRHLVCMDKYIQGVKFLIFIRLLNRE